MELSAHILLVFVPSQMEQLSDEEVEVREEEEDEEEDSDKEDQDLDKMFGAWLGELDKLTQVNVGGFKYPMKMYLSCRYLIWLG